MRVLVGSAGGYTGQYLVDYYLDTLSCEVYAFDVSSLNYSKYRCGDRFFIAPKISEGESFISWLVDIINKYGIKLYLPTYSKEFELVSLYSNRLKQETNCYFLVSPAETVFFFLNKEVYYKKLREKGYDVPQIVSSVNDKFEFPLFYKETSGSGSHNAQKITTPDILKACLGREEGMCVEYVEGREVTVDCFFDPDGNLLGCNARTREKTLGGMAVICKNWKDERIEPVVRRLSREFRFAGCINVQFILTADRIVLIDLNTRYPSGGLPLTVESGIDVPRIMLELAEDKGVEPRLCQNDGKARVMYRHFQQYYEIEE